jgi:hypothetical protein
MALRALAEALDHVIRSVLDRKVDRHRVPKLLRFGALVAWSLFGFTRAVPRRRLPNSTLPAGSRFSARTTIAPD